MESNDTLENKPARETIRIYDYDVADRSDETDLVDLWIFFWKRKSLFLSSVILVSIVGIVCFEMLYVPKRISTVRSLVEVSEISVERLEPTNAYSAALARRITFADLPGYALEKEFESIAPYVMSSSINAIEGTNLIEILTNVPSGAVAEVSIFHDRFTTQIVADLKSSPYASNGSLREELLVSVNDGVRRLRNQLNGFYRGLRHDDDMQTLSKQADSAARNIRLDTIILEIDEISEELELLEAILLEIKPRVVVVASVSEKVSGMKKSVAYSLIILLAIFLAIFIVVGGAFAARVKERMAGRG